MKREEEPDAAQLRSTISALEQLLEVQERCVVEQSDNVQRLLRDIEERNAEMNRLNGALQAEVTERTRAEEALRSVNETLRAIVQASPLGIVVLDCDGMIRMWNPASARIFGWSDEEVLGRPMPFIPPDKLEESRALRARVLRNEIFSDVELVRRKKDGSPIEISLSTAALHDAGGNVSGILGLMADITERKRTEQALIESRAKLKAIFDAATEVAIIATDPDGLIAAFNSGAEKMLGYSTEDMVGKQTPAVFHLESEMAVRAKELTERLGRPIRGFDVFVEHARQAGAEEREWTYVRKNGTHLTVRLAVTALRDHRGSITGFLGVASDITERQRAEAALRESEEQYRALFDSSRDALLLLDQQGFFDCNAAAVQLFGAASKAQLIGTPPWDVSPPTQPDGVESLVAAKDRMAKAYEQGTQFFEWLHRRLDGSLFSADVLLSRYERRGKPALQADVRDITDRKREQEQLMEQLRMRAFSADVGEALAGASSLAEGLHGCTDAMVRRLNGAFARIWTLDPSGTELVMRASSGLYTNLEGAHYRIPVGRFKIGLIAQEQKPHLTNNVIGDPRVPQQDWAKREGMVAFAGYPLLLEGRVLGVMAMFARQPLSENVLQVMHNVAQSVAQFVERKKTEAALAEALARLQALVRSAPIGITILDTAGHVILWNPACEALFGWTEQEVLGRPLPTVPESKRDELQSVMERARREKFVRIPDTKRVTKDGRIVSVELSVALLRNASNEVIGYLGIIIDLTERKRLEARAHQVDRLSALTQVLGGIAHQLKNPLFILMGQQQLLKDAARRYHYDEVMADIRKTQETAKRLAAIVEQFLHLAGPVVPDQGRSSVLAAVTRTVDHLGWELERKHIQVAVACPQDLPDIAAAPALLEDIFLQLMRNAIEAMAQAHGRGTLTVSASVSPTRGHGDAETRGQGEGEQWIEVKIQDDGPGIPPALRNKLFEPFFTTKPSGEGTGLGLWVVRSNLMMLHGRVRVESEAGQGATFVVQLPVVTESPLPADPPLAGTGQASDQDRKDHP